MIFRIDKILQDVRICLDENRIDEALLQTGDEDTLSLDEMIRSVVVEAVDRVHMAAPYYLLGQGHNLMDALYDNEDNLVRRTPSVHWGTLESGWIVLPDDFMRLVVFEMSDWERPVYAVITPESPMFDRQRSRVKALRGTAQRPVCLLCVRPEGKVLEFYSCKSTNATVTRAVYMPHAMMDDRGGVDISERCYDAVVYTAAGLTLNRCKEADKAAVLMELAKTYLQK